MQTLINTITVIGCAAGAMSAGNMTKLGRWTGMIIANVVMIVGCLLCLVRGFYGDHFFIFIGRFVYGVSVGLFSFFSPKYISEFSPIVIRGGLGALNQVFICFGIMIPFVLNPFYLPHTGENHEIPNPKSPVTAETFFRLIFCLPILVSLTQMILLFFFFRFETPIVMKERNEDEKLKKVLNKIYKPETADDVFNHLKTAQAASTASNSEGEGNNVKYKDLFYNPKYSRAFYVGSTCAIL